MYGLKINTKAKSKPHEGCFDVSGWGGLESART